MLHLSAHASSLPPSQSLLCPHVVDMRLFLSVPAVSAHRGQAHWLLQPRTLSTVVAGGVWNDQSAGVLQWAGSLPFHPVCLWAFTLAPQ